MWVWGGMFGQMTDPEALLLQGRGYNSSAGGLQLKTQSIYQSLGTWGGGWEAKSIEEKEKIGDGEGEGGLGGGGGGEVHLGELLVIFRPDLHVSPAPTCLPSTTCFLSVPVDPISPQHCRHALPLCFLLSFFILSRSPPPPLLLRTSAVTSPPLCRYYFFLSISVSINIEGNAV